MNNRSLVLIAAGVLALSACSNDPPYETEEGAEAAAAAERARASAAETIDHTGTAISEGADAAAARTREAAEIGRAHV